MNEANDQFGAAPIRFEDSSGFLGTSQDEVPEPITSLLLNAYVEVDEGQVIEGYWLRAVDDSAMPVVNQIVMHSFDFRQVSRLLAAIFQSCGQGGEPERRVGLGYTAYHNRLARQLHPELTDHPVENLACMVSGFPDRGVRVSFATADGSPAPVAAFQGRLVPDGLHAMARGFREMAEWRFEALNRARKQVIPLHAKRTDPRRAATERAAPAGSAAPRR